MRLVILIIRIFHDAWSPERQIYCSCFHVYMATGLNNFRGKNFPCHYECNSWGAPNLICSECPRSFHSGINDKGIELTFQLTRVNRYFFIRRSVKD